MAILKRRSRMVSFRISEEEYEDLMAVCNARGARSLSDLARDAIQVLVGGGLVSERLVNDRFVDSRLVKRLGDEVLAADGSMGGGESAAGERLAMAGHASGPGVGGNHHHGSARIGHHAGHHEGVEFEVETILKRMDEMDHELKRLAKLILSSELAAEKTA